MFEMGPDRLERRLDIGEPLAFPIGRNATSSSTMCAHEAQ